MRAYLVILTLAVLSAAPGLVWAAEHNGPIPLIPETALEGRSQIRSDADLSAMAGGQSTTTAMAMTEQDLTAISSGNRITADNVGSGAISLTDNALSGFSGIGNFTMNTGHNNNLQSSMIVTVIVTH